MSKRLDYIDALRGVAALMVVVQHGTEMAFSHAPAGPLRHWITLLFLDDFDLGWAGVVAFFCISGFVVPFSFSGSRPLRNFLVARFFRLYPPYWVSIAAALLAYSFLGAPSFPMLQVAANMTMVQKLLHRPDIIGVYWTLFIEILFYTLCFAAFALGWLKSSRNLFIGVLALLAVAVTSAVGHAFGRHLGGSGSIPFFLAVMVMGTLTRRRLLEGDAPAGWMAPLSLAALVVAAPVVTYCGFSADSIGAGWIAQLTGFYVGLSLFLACAYRKAFANRTTVFLGAISYALYLFHVLVGICLEPVFERLSWPVSAWIFLPGMVAASIIAGSVVHWLVERPSIAAGRRITHGDRAKQLPALATTL